MKTTVIITFCLVLWSSVHAQPIYTPNITNDELEFENIHSEKIYSDSLASSFLITIKKSVALHKHAYHTEHIYVLQGTGDMIHGDKHISIAKGDVIIIPKNTPHSLEVTSMEAVQIISIQSPEFVGKDRIFIK